jgi:multidrug efflux pump subunit AcrB
MHSSLNPIVFALRRPITVMAGVLALAVACILALVRMPIDIFPTLDLPVIYIAQPYGGLNPSDMESQVIAYIEGHAFYINGLHHVESRTVQGMGVVKLFFHPGTNMAQAMAETVGYVNRARGYQPQGTLPPFIVRFDVSNVPIGYLVAESDGKRPLSQVADLVLRQVRPIFATLPGVSSPPPMGSNLRTILVNVDPDRLRAYRLSPDEVVAALSAGNVVLPSGNVRIRDRTTMVSANSLVRDPKELGDIAIRPGQSLYLRDLATIHDDADTSTGYALVNGKRTVYMMVNKTAEASTLSVVHALRANLPRMQESVPADIKLRFDFDQSPYVTRAMWGVASEGALGAVLTGLMVLLFLRDWRSVIVVVLNIPLALMGAIVALYATGQTLNLMTLGGLALAVGILVDEATVEVENIHSQLERTDSVALAVRRGNSETAVPRLLAMLCVLAVFLPMFFMQGAARNLFVPLALAVGFSMITSYLLSSMFVPVVSVWLLRKHTGAVQGHRPTSRLVSVHGRLLETIVRHRGAVVAVYLAACLGIVLLAGSQVGTQIFPNVDTGQFSVRLRAPTGTRIEHTEELARQMLKRIEQEAGPGNVQTSVGFVGTTPPAFSNQAIYLWSSGPEEAQFRVGLSPEAGLHVEAFKERLRRVLPDHLANWYRTRLRRDGLGEAEVNERAEALRLSFGPADIVNEVMSFGAPSPIEVAVYGMSLKDNLAHAEKIRRELAKVPGLRDLQLQQAQDYPTVDVRIDREKLGLSGSNVQEVGKALLSATSSSRYVIPLYWADTKIGMGYQIQLQVPPPRMDSTLEIAQVPIRQTPSGTLLLRDVADVREGQTPGEYDRLFLRRMVSLTAGLEGSDLGGVARQVHRAIARAGSPPRGVRVEVRGQVEPLEQIFTGLAVGLALAVVAIFLLLLAYFQSPRLALSAVAAVPAVLAGVAVALWLTGTSLNLQSFMGAIMSIGVAIANAILLLTFAEKARQEGSKSAVAAVLGARHRLRPILMTSCAMLAGMIPMALGLGEGGEQTAPLGRAVVGGLLSATAATLLVLPAVFAFVQGKAATRSASLDPGDTASPHYHPEATSL